MTKAWDPTDWRMEAITTRQLFFPSSRRTLVAVSEQGVSLKTGEADLCRHWWSDFKVYHHGLFSIWPYARHLLVAMGLVVSNCLIDSGRNKRQSICCRERKWGVVAEMHSQHYNEWTLLTFSVCFSLLPNRPYEFHFSYTSNTSFPHVLSSIPFFCPTLLYTSDT